MRLARLLGGHVLDMLRDLPDESVHMVVTSPPYWSLRDYKTRECTFGVGQVNEWTGHLGLEPDPEMYVEHLVEIFREVRRVLRRDGSMWLNIGDTYYTAKGSCRNPGGGENSLAKHLKVESVIPMGESVPNRTMPISRARELGIKPKDMVGIPWMLAFALRRDGWFLRSEVVWEKMNCMPESTTDRPVRSHEPVFFFTKSGDPLYWTHPRKRGVRTKPKADFIWVHRRNNEVCTHQPVGNVRLLGKLWLRRNLWVGHDYFFDDSAVLEQAAGNPLKQEGKNSRINLDRDTNHSAKRKRGNVVQNAVHLMRRRRSVWTIAVQAYPGAHFATFPLELVKIPIMASSSQAGCCPDCGAPWERVLEHRDFGDWHYSPALKREGVKRNRKAKWMGADKQAAGRRILENVKKARNEGRDHEHPFPPPRTLGWRATCDCTSMKPEPCTVLDPFAGAFTAGVAALRLDRDFYGIELNPAYIKMGAERIQSDAPLFNRVVICGPKELRDGIRENIDGRGLFSQEKRGRDQGTIRKSPERNVG